MDEGYIKFNCDWNKANPIPIAQLTEIIKWRDLLHNLGLIGVYDNGIGFGNISIRDKGNTFIISGSATGGLKTLNENHFVIVNEYDLADNRITCSGPIQASSESLSHAVLYECSSEVNSVIHIHNLSLWKQLLYKVPTTSETALFGTPELAYEIKRVFNETKVCHENIIALAGHEEGFISFGKTLDEAGTILLEKLQTLKTGMDNYRKQTK